MTKRKHSVRSWLVGLAAVALTVFMAPAAGAAPIEQKGRIESVTLYRGEALVTRVVSVDAPAGPVALVVTELPERVQPDSLYAGADQGMKVRAVRYRSRPVGRAPREEVRGIEEQIEALNRKMRSNQAQSRRLNQQEGYLAKLQKFVAPTAQMEITHGVLKQKELEGLTVFIFGQMTKFSEEDLALGETRKEMEKELARLNRELANLTTTHARTLREAVVFLDKEAADPVPIRLSYIVKDASWTPSYNLRAGAEMENVQVEYNAIIRQMSGEDWAAVELALSTASPDLAADPPLLGSFPVVVSSEAPRQTYVPGRRRRTRELVKGRSGVGRSSQELQSQVDINVSSWGFQGQELSASGETADLLRAEQREEGSALSVNYKLDGTVDVASRSDQQIVRIAELTLPARISNVAVPVLTERVYRQAEVTNTSDIALLAGRCSVYVDGDFVGKGTLPVVATGQRFKAGLGSDPQLRAWREFVSRDEQVQGGNKKVTFRYRLVLDNYKDEPITVRASDRIPHAGSEVRVTLGEMADPLSKDEEYERAFRPKGILRWDVEVPAHSAARTARIIDYCYILEFDRNKHVVPMAGPEAAAEMGHDLDMQLKAH